jgi:hypothetical protein
MKYVYKKKFDELKLKYKIFIYNIVHVNSNHVVEMYIKVSNFIWNM